MRQLHVGAAADAIPQLIQALEDERKGIRKEAVIALSKIGPAAKAALPAMAALSQEPIIGYHAREAIERIENR